MTDMIKELGLGFVLKFTDRTSSEIASARRHVQGLRSDTEGLTRSFGSHVTQIGNAAGMLQVAFKGIVAAAPIVMLNKLTNAALESERQMMDLTTVIMSQGAKSHSEIVKQVDEAQKAIWETARKVPGTLDEMEKSIGDMRALLGKDLYLDALDPIARLSYIDSQGKNYSTTFNLVAASLFKFRSSLPGDTDLEKVNAVGDALAVMKGYGLGIEDIGQTILRASKNAAIYNNDFYEMLAMMIPVVRQSSNPRMAGSAIEQTFDALAQYTETVKDLRKRGQKKGPVTWGEATGASGEKEAIHPEARWLLNLKVTNAEGVILPFPDVLSQIEKGMKITRARSEEVADLVKTGKLKPEEILTKGYGVSAYTASLMQQLFPGIGLFVGQLDLIKESESKLANERGLVSSIFDEQMLKAAAQTDKLTGNLKVLTDQVGDHLTPALNTFLKTINPWLETLGKTMEEHPTTTKAVVLAGAAAGAGASLYVGGRAIKGTYDIFRGLGARVTGAELPLELAKTLTTVGNTYKPMTAADRAFEMGIMKGYPPATQAAKPAWRTWGEPLTARLGGASPEVMSGFERVAMMGGKLGAGIANIGTAVLTWYANQGVSSLSQIAAEQGHTVDQLLRQMEASGMQILKQPPHPSFSADELISSLRNGAAPSATTVTQAGPDSVASGRDRTIYQSNYFTFLEATADTAQEAASIIDKNARQKAETGTSGRK